MLVNQHRIPCSVIRLPNHHQPLRPTLHSIDQIHPSGFMNNAREASALSSSVFSHASGKIQPSKQCTVEHSTLNSFQQQKSSPHSKHQKWDDEQCNINTSEFNAKIKSIKNKSQSRPFQLKQIAESSFQSILLQVNHLKNNKLEYCFTSRSHKQHLKKDLLEKSLHLTEFGISFQKEQLIASHHRIANQICSFQKLANYKKQEHVENLKNIENRYEKSIQALIKLYHLEDSKNKDYLRILKLSQHQGAFQSNRSSIQSHPSSNADSHERFSFGKT